MLEDPAGKYLGFAPRAIVKLEHDLETAVSLLPNAGAFGFIP
jgi:hypothetical protein